MDLSHPLRWIASDLYPTTLAFRHPIRQAAGRCPDSAGGALNNETMGLCEIERLPVPAIAAFDAPLFLWVTDPFLPDCLNVMQRWEFAFKQSTTMNTNGGLPYGQFTPIPGRQECAKRQSR